MAKPKPPDRSDKAGAEDPKSGMERFKSLTKGLLNVPRDEIADAEREYQSGRSGRGRPSDA